MANNQGFNGGKVIGAGQAGQKPGQGIPTVKNGPQGGPPPMNGSYNVDKTRGGTKRLEQQGDV